MMKEYNTFEDIDTDLKRLNLERQIAIEELKLVQIKIEEEFKPYNLILTAFKVVSKIGLFKILKKIMK
ncbi:hypothetical protein [Gaetbulibacter saemankumensis]|uniref:hypothetical protein n=1 Tax=Gaetbulibacter saemankumensis TaxID=311208 RepID=UPI00054F9962|nr:hypothetical protein [Gaetbulibacter saemankumensis]